MSGQYPMLDTAIVARHANATRDVGIMLVVVLCPGLAGAFLDEVQIRVLLKSSDVVVCVTTGVTTRHTAPAREVCPPGFPWEEVLKADAFDVVIAHAVSGDTQDDRVFSMEAVMIVSVRGLTGEQHTADCELRLFSSRGLYSGTGVSVAPGERFCFHDDVSFCGKR